MNTKFLAAAVLAASSAGFTHVVSAATIYNTAPIYGGPLQDNAVCYIYNAGGPGSLPIHFVNVNSRIGSLQDIIVTNVVTGVGSNCPGIGSAGLAAGRACYLQANIGNSLAHTCRAWVFETGASLRVNLEIRDGSNVLQHINGEKP